MITQMRVKQFKALKDVTVDLTPLTVLIGQNDTGKTSFLEAAFAIGESTRSPLANCFWSPWQNRELVHNRAADGQVEFAVVLAESQDSSDGHSMSQERLAYSVTMSFSQGHNCSLVSERIGPGAREATEEVANRGHITSVFRLKAETASFPDRVEPHLRAVADRLPPAALARWDVEELAMPSRLPPPTNRRYPFDPSGYGLASCIAEIKLGPEGHFEVLRDNFCSQFPAFKDIIIRPTTVRGIERDPHFQKNPGSSGDGYALVLVRKDGVEIPAGLASGGTLVTLGFLTLTHLPEPRKLLLVEEPENALHPGRLREIVPVLRSALASRKDCQVILTTHSPLLLDYVQPEEVRVFLRNAQDDIEVHNLADVPDIHDRLKYLMLGELVYNEGEQELIKEIREHARTHSGRGAN